MALRTQDSVIRVRVLAGEHMRSVSRSLGLDIRTVRYYCGQAGIVSSYVKKKTPEDMIVEAWWRIRDGGSSISAEARRLMMSGHVLTGRLAPYRRHHVSSGGEDPVRRVRRK